MGYMAAIADIQPAPPAADAQAMGTVLSADGSTAQVLLDGSAEATPAQLNVSAKQGDRVRVQIDALRAAAVVANITEPPNRSASIGGAGYDPALGDYVQISPGWGPDADGANKSQLYLSGKEGWIAVNGNRVAYFTPDGEAEIPRLDCSWLYSLNAVDFKKSSVGSMPVVTIHDTLIVRNGGDTWLIIEPITDESGNGNGFRLHTGRFDEGYEEIIGEVAVDIDAAGVRVKAPSVDIDGNLTVGGKPVLVEEV